MKWLALLVSMYILSLASMPCVDEPNHVCTKHQEHSTQNDTQQNNNLPNTCSPFCVCACCNVSVVVSFYFVNTIPSRLVQNAYIPFYENITSRFNVSIWQPPKIG